MRWPRPAPPEPHGAAGLRGWENAREIRGWFVLTAAGAGASCIVLSRTRPGSVRWDPGPATARRSLGPPVLLSSSRGVCPSAGSRLCPTVRLPVLPSPGCQLCLAAYLILRSYWSAARPAAGTGSRPPPAGGLGRARPTSGSTRHGPEGPGQARTGRDRQPASQPGGSARPWQGTVHRAAAVVFTQVRRRHKEGLSADASPRVCCVPQDRVPSSSCDPLRARRKSLRIGPPAALWKRSRRWR